MGLLFSLFVNVLYNYSYGQMCLLIENVSQVSIVAHGPLGC